MDDTGFSVELNDGRSPGIGFKKLEIY